MSTVQNKTNEERIAALNKVIEKIKKAIEILDFRPIAPKGHPKLLDTSDEFTEDEAYAILNEMAGPEWAQTLIDILKWGYSLQLPAFESFSSWALGQGALSWKISIAGLAQLLVADYVRLGEDGEVLDIDLINQLPDDTRVDPMVRELLTRLKLYNEEHPRNICKLNPLGLPCANLDAPIKAFIHVEPPMQSTIIADVSFCVTVNMHAEFQIGMTTDRLDKVKQEIKERFLESDYLMNIIAMAFNKHDERWGGSTYLDEVEEDSITVLDVSLKAQSL